MRQPENLIIGGGIIGLTTAWKLAQAGRRVQIIDRGDFGAEASWAGAGIIPPAGITSDNDAYVSQRSKCSPIEELRAQSSQAFFACSTNLCELTGIDNGYRVCGGIDFWPIDQLPFLWDKLNVRYERIGSADVQALEPALLPPVGIPYLLPDLAQVRNPWHLRALVSACRKMSVDLKPQVEAGQLVAHGSVVKGYITPRRSFLADQVLITAGAWTDELLAPLGWTAGVRPIRGQMVLVRTPAPLLRRVIEVGKNYLVPREDGRLLIGATEEDVGFCKQTTVAGVSDLLALAKQWVPRLANAEVEKTWAGLRPASADGWPYLGRVPGFTNLFVGAGHFRAGVQLSLASADILSAYLLGTSVPEWALAFRPDRPPVPAFEPAFRS
jgi:glycine oxidase